MELLLSLKFLVDGLCENLCELFLYLLGQGFLVYFIKFSELGVSLFDCFGYFLSFGSLSLQDFFSVVQSFL